MHRLGADALAPSRASAPDSRTSGTFIAPAGYHSRLWAQILRLVVIVLLLGTAAELGTELFNSCEPFVADLAAGCEDESGQSDCFCCCAHVVVQRSLVLSLSLQTQSAAIQHPPAFLPSGAFRVPFLPPRT